MTKNNELRIGNFVTNSQGEVCTVSQLFVDIVEESEQITISCNPPGKGSEIINFIPLSASLLTAIRFKRKTLGTRFVYSNDSINLTSDFRLCTFYNSTIAPIGESIQFLHRLQNLHFCLYGTEMEIAKEDVLKGAKK